MYLLEKDPEKKNMKSVFIRCVLPSITTTLLAILILKNQNTPLFSSEPVMQGGFFDAVPDVP
jgi:hypothetical protein